jgi:flagellar motor switch protein FliM
MLLGGDGKLCTELDRELTELETTLLGECFELLASELSQAWSSPSPVTFRPGAIQGKLGPTNIVPSETVLVVGMDLQIGEAVGKMSLMVPGAILKALAKGLEQTRAPRKAESPESEEALRKRLAASLKLQVDCELRGVFLGVRDLLQLSPGQIIDLGAPMDTPLEVVINGLPKFRCSVAVSETKLTGIVE